MNSVVCAQSACALKDTTYDLPETNVKTTRACHDLKLGTLDVKRKKNRGVAVARTFDGYFTAIFLFVSLLIALELMGGCILTCITC
jgi:hypothetical protein